MILKEIYQKKWTVSKNLEIAYSNLTSLCMDEQNCHFNILKEGYNSDKTEVHFSCSFQEWVTKLSKSKLVTIQNVLISKNLRNDKFVLEIKGLIHTKGLSIRKGIVRVSEERKKQMAKHMQGLRVRTLSHE